MNKKKETVSIERYTNCSHFVCNNCLEIQRDAVTKEVKEIMRFDGIRFQDKCVSCDKAEPCSLRRV
jgi:hypothetical protein